MERKTVKLGDIAMIQSGGTPKRSNSDYWSDGNIPWVKISDIKSGHVSKTEESITELGLKESSAKIFPKGTILYTIFATLGEVAILDIDAATNQAIAGIQLEDERITNQYLYYFLTSRKNFVENIGRGVAQNNINMTMLKSFEIPLVDKDAQIKICHVLNKIDSILTLQRKRLTKLDTLVKAEFVELFGDPMLNPKKWDLVPLENIAHVGSSKRVFVNELKDDGIPFFRGTEIGELAEDKSIKPQLFITKEHYEVLCESSGRPEKGDLLLPSICSDGRIWLVNTDKPFYFKDGRVLWIHPLDKNFNSKFLQQVISKKLIADYTHIASGTTFSELKIFNLKQLEVPNPPVSLQNQFADFVVQVEKSKSSVHRVIHTLETLRASLMQTYFHS